VADQTTFEVADAKSYRGSYDLICFFDCLHDMGDPVGVAEYAREHLAEGGTVLLVEPFALDDRHSNLTQNPMAPLLYTASSCICTPNSLSQEVGLGLGAQAGTARLRDVFAQAGFTHFRLAAETPHPGGPRLIEGWAAVAVASVGVPTTVTVTAPVRCASWSEVPRHDRQRGGNERGGDLHGERGYLLSPAQVPSELHLTQSRPVTLL
jgi:hypothetical protein